MKQSNPDKTNFIKAAMKVQDKFAAEKGAEFQALIEAIRAEAK